MPKGKKKNEAAEDFYIAADADEESTPAPQSDTKADPAPAKVATKPAKKTAVEGKPETKPGPKNDKNSSKKSPANKPENNAASQGTKKSAKPGKKGKAQDDSAYLPAETSENEISTTDVAATKSKPAPSEAEKVPEQEQVGTTTPAVTKVSPKASTDASTVDTEVQKSPAQSDLKEKPEVPTTSAESTEPAAAISSTASEEAPPETESKPKKADKAKKPAVKSAKEKAIERKALMLEAIRKRQEEEERLRKEAEQRRRKEMEDAKKREAEEAERERKLEIQRHINKEKKKERDKKRKEIEDNNKRLLALQRLGIEVTSGGVVQKTPKTWSSKSKEAREQPQEGGATSPSNESTTDKVPTPDPQESAQPAVETDVKEVQASAKAETTKDIKVETKPDGHTEALDSWEAALDENVIIKSKGATKVAPIKDSAKPAASAPATKGAKTSGPSNAKATKGAKKAATKVATEAPAPAEPVVKEMRSPICCVLGHVDTGKTKLLDKIRRTNVQDGEVGGITQQIGASYFPMETIKVLTKRLTEQAPLAYKVPGLLIIDTPGHASFSNLRSRGSSLCDIAILVVDLMHGLEPQTIESINMLRERKTPFVVALNKVDCLYSWKAFGNAPIRDALERQTPDVRYEYERRVKETIAQFAVQNLNACLYYENTDMARWVSLVPTSAITGEGIPDLLYLLVRLTQTRMSSRLLFLEDKLQCTVLEVKVTEGLGTCIDVILVNGVLHQGDTIVVCGMHEPIVTTIRALLIPQPLREMRVKSPYEHCDEVRAAMGVKIAAANLDEAVAGSSLLVYHPDGPVSVDELREEVQRDLKNMQAKVDKSGVGVYVQASTLGSLEALLVFLKESNIPVFAINLGPVHKKDVIKASVMIDKPATRKFAVILAFDVRIEREAEEIAATNGVTIFRADIIYHLFDQFTEYIKNIDLAEKEAANKSGEVIWPCILEVLPQFVFATRDPIIVGVAVRDGSVRVGTPLCVPSKKFISVGRVASIEVNNRTVPQGNKGEEVCLRIEQRQGQQQYMYGRHFDNLDLLVSEITPESLAALKKQYGTELSKEEICLLGKLKHEVFCFM
ncbi:eukaryotic translation initiation factor 5B [Pelomyxa schiedti]|nr:eukaryotic translation initiation factor 5B [Pelomyxa schiedti]